MAIPPRRRARRQRGGDRVRVGAQHGRAAPGGGGGVRVEHGLSPEAKAANWQRRLEPAQRRLADGCHLTRVPTALAEEAGFVVERTESRYARGPKPWSWFTEGVALNPG